jgi:CHAD domain-containing protein
MRETLEREIKLLPGEGFVMPDLGVARPTRTFVTTYHDAVDLRLLRHGITLRYRVEDGEGNWQLKLPRGAARLELELAGTPSQPPVDVLALLVAHLRGDELVPIARLRTRRETRFADGAEIVDDTVSVMEGLSVVRRFRELEIELIEGSEVELARLRDELVVAGAAAVALPAKVYRALGLAPAGLVESPLAVDAVPAEALGIALEREYLRLLAHDPGARRGDDPEDLHQLRVSVRRLRAYLRTARRLLDPEWVVPLRNELRWLGSALGPARDLDVMLERLREDLRSLGADARVAARLLSGLEAERAVAYATVLAALDSPRYLSLVERLESAVAPPLAATGEVETLAVAWRREAQRMRRTFTRLDDEPADDALHTARIAVKRARYAAELAAHELGEPGARFVAAAKDLQDILGDHQDTCFYETRVRQWLALEAAGSFVAGRLVERALERRAQCREAWRPAWRRVRRRARAVPS